MQNFLMRLLVSVGVLSLSSAQAAGPEGLWKTENGRSHILIELCGDAYCGKIVALQEPFAKSGLPKTDVNNPNPLKRGQPLIGLVIVRGMKPSHEGGSWSGEIYNPQDGNVYRATMTLRPDGLKVEGCFAYILCGAQIWARAAKPSD